MAVYNLGQVPANEEKVNPYANQLMDMSKLMLSHELDIEKIKESRQAQALAEQVKAAAEKKEKDLQFFRGTWQNLSDKPKNERELFLQTDQGKEYLKTAKKYIPEVFDENSEPILFPSSKDPQTYKQQVEDQIASVKKKMMEEGPDSLKEGELNILKMEGYKDEIAEATSILMKSSEFQYLIQSDSPEDQKVAQNMVNGVMQQILQAKGKLGEMKAQNRYSNELKLGDQASGLATAASNFTNPFNPVNTENPNTALLAPRTATTTGAKSGGRYKVRRLN